jgi:hypothetical protein
LESLANATIMETSIVEKKGELLMEVTSAFGNAVAGIQRGMEGMARNAEEITRAAGSEGGDIVTPLLESHLNQLQVEASAKVINTLDDTIGSLLDEMA